MNTPFSCFMYYCCYIWRLWLKYFWYRTISQISYYIYIYIYIYSINTPLQFFRAVSSHFGTFYTPLYGSRTIPGCFCMITLDYGKHRKCVNTLLSSRIYSQRGDTSNLRHYHDHQLPLNLMVRYTTCAGYLLGNCPWFFFYYCYVVLEATK